MQKYELQEHKKITKMCNFWDVSHTSYTYIEFDENENRNQNQMSTNGQYP